MGYEASPQSHRDHGEIKSSRSVLVIVTTPTGGATAECVPVGRTAEEAGERRGQDNESLAPVSPGEMAGDLGRLPGNALFYQRVASSEWRVMAMAAVTKCAIHTAQPGYAPTGLVPVGR